GPVDDAVVGRDGHRDRVALMHARGVGEVERVRRRGRGRGRLEDGVGRRVRPHVRHGDLIAVGVRRGRRRGHGIAHGRRAVVPRGAAPRTTFRHRSGVRSGRFVGGGVGGGGGQGGYVRLVGGGGGAEVEVVGRRRGRVRPEDRVGGRVLPHVRQRDRIA